MPLRICNDVRRTIWRLHDEGLTNIAISLEVGRNSSSVAQILRDSRLLPLPGEEPRREIRRLTADQIAKEGVAILPPLVRVLWPPPREGPLPLHKRPLSERIQDPDIALFHEELAKRGGGEEVADHA